MTKTNQIFSLTAPYNNRYQGNFTRLLFVCTVGMLRSPTGAEIGVEFGYNTRSCGYDDVALIQLSANLISWADHIIFVSKSDEILALKKFENTGWDEDILAKKITLAIDDEYDFGNPELRLIFRNYLKQLEDSEKLRRTRD